MSKNLSDNYYLSLICVTILLIISLGINTFLIKNGWALIPTSFGYLGFVVTIASALRTICPQVRKNGLYQFAMLFNVTALAQIVRKRMNEMREKRKKNRQEFLVVGTAAFPLSIFWIVGIFLLGGTYVNTDNGTSVSVMAIIEKITASSLFALIMAGSLLVLSIFSIRFGFGKCEKWIVTEKVSDAKN